MKLVDDYLRAIALLLPKDQREDIVAELRDTILTRIEGRESELGRPLTEDETEALLREIGHPLVVAGRYRGGPQQLIGPAIYPYWAFGVKVALTILLALSGVIFLVRAFSGGDVGMALAQTFSSAFSGVIALVGFATIAAWLVERRAIRIDYLENWKVRDLRVLEFGSWDLRAPSAPAAPSPPGWRGPPRDPRGPSRSPAAQAVGAIAGGSVLMLWWLGVLDFGAPGLAGMGWSGVKAALFWPVLVYFALIIFRGGMHLVLPRSLVLQGSLDVGLGAAMLVLVDNIWEYSSLSLALSIDSLVAWINGLSALHGRPGGAEVYGIPLGPLLTLILASTALAAAIKIIQGLFAIAWATLTVKKGPVPRSAGFRP